MAFLKSKQVCKLTIDTSTIDQNYVLYIQKVRLIYKKRQMSSNLHVGCVFDLEIVYDYIYKYIVWLRVLIC